MSSFQNSDLNALVLDLGRAAATIKAKAYGQAKTSIGAIEATARTFVPRRTGATAASISSEVQIEAGSVVAESGPTTRHARFVEWGTYKDAPQAFMGPALDRHSGEFEGGLANEAEQI